LVGIEAALGELGETSPLKKRNHYSFEKHLYKLNILDNNTLVVDYTYKILFHNALSRWKTSTTERDFMTKKQNKVEQVPTPILKQVYGSAKAGATTL
jgi:hypothetical protein